MSRRLPQHGKPMVLPKCVPLPPGAFLLSRHAYATFLPLPFSYPSFHAHPLTPPFTPRNIPRGTTRGSMHYTILRYKMKSLRALNHPLCRYPPPSRVLSTHVELHLCGVASSGVYSWWMTDLGMRSSCILAAFDFVGCGLRRER